MGREQPSLGPARIGHQPDASVSPAMDWRATRATEEGHHARASRSSRQKTQAERVARFAELTAGFRFKQSRSHAASLCLHALDGGPVGVGLAHPLAFSLHIAILLLGFSGLTERQVFMNAKRSSPLLSPAYSLHTIILFFPSDVAVLVSVAALCFSVTAFDFGTSQVSAIGVLNSRTCVRA